MFENKEQGGRSMIEMLGVLAIIGVLSVAGIAGYSKAMQTWKLNKWKAQITDLVFSTKEIYKNERHFGKADEDVLPTLLELGAIPKDMLDEKRRDMFGNSVSMQISNAALSDGSDFWRLAIFFGTQPSTTAEMNCRELYTFPLADPDVHAVVNWANYYRVCGKYTDEEYKKKYPCSEYNMQQVADKCEICREQACTLILLYRND